MTLVIIISGIDLSVGSVAAFAGMISAILVSKNVPIIIAVLAGVVLGAALGLVTGILIAKFGLPDFIASLAMMEIARGAALLTTQGVPVFGLSNEFKFIGGGFIGKVSVSGIIWIILTIFFALLLKYTSFGRSLFAIGGNREAATLSGIKTTRNYAITYVLCAALAAFAGVLTASWLATGQPTAGDGMELNAIAASVIGGASLSGGIGSMLGTFGGVFLLQIITNIFKPCRSCFFLSADRQKVSLSSQLFFLTELSMQKNNRMMSTRGAYHNKKLHHFKGGFQHEKKRFPCNSDSNGNDRVYGSLRLRGRRRCIHRRCSG